MVRLTLSHAVGRTGRNQRDRMQNSRITRVVVIENEQGLHARPAELLARLARQFQSHVEVIRDDRRVEASSIMDLLTLGAVQGTSLIVAAEGDDAEQAVDALARLVRSGFRAETNNKLNKNESQTAIGSPPSAAPE